MNFNATIETLILVAIWEQPLIFQGCFKISASGHEKFFFFRYECPYLKEEDIIHKDYCPSHYQLTHFYTQEQPISLLPHNEAQEHAFYILNYAFYITLKEMVCRQIKKPMLSVDEVVLNSLLNQIKPMLDKNSPLAEHLQEIGFAVKMDFYPQEIMGELAVRTLLFDFKESLNDSLGFH